MLKQLRKLFSNQGRRTGIIIAAALLLIAAVFIFTELELGHNRQLVISNYTAKQQEITDQAALRMNTYLTAQTTDNETLINKLISEVKTEGSSYWFIAENDELLFVKNHTTSALFENITLSTFLQQCKADSMKVTTGSFTIDNNHYTVGNCTSLDYIVDDGQLFRHHIYIIMPIILLSAFFFILIIYGTTRISEQKDKIHQLNSEAMERNIRIEKLTAEIKKSRLNQLGNTEKTGEAGPVIYNNDVLASLLEKIGREKIVPLTIAVIEFDSGNPNMLPEDFNKIMKTVSPVLDQEHVLAQIFPGAYTLLMFRTTAEQNNSIKDNLIKKWAIPLNKQGIKMKIGISRIEDYDADVKNIFDTICKEVLSKLNECRENRM